MLFCHKIHYIWMINALLSQNLVVEIYALFPPIFLGQQIVSAIFFAFWIYVYFEPGLFSARIFLTLSFNKCSQNVFKIV